MESVFNVSSHIWNTKSLYLHFYGLADDCSFSQSTAFPYHGSIDSKAFILGMLSCMKGQKHKLSKRINEGKIFPSGLYFDLSPGGKCTDRSTYTISLLRFLSVYCTWRLTPGRVCLPCNASWHLMADSLLQNVTNAHPTRSREGEESGLEIERMNLN